jgi:hypothetical protein
VAPSVGDASVVIVALGVSVRRRSSRRTVVSMIVLSLVNQVVEKWYTKLSLSGEIDDDVRQ